MKKLILESGLLFCLIHSLIFCNIQTAKADSNLTVEGVWEVISVSPVTSDSPGILGSKVSIVRKGDSYELMWLTGSRANNESVNYSGSTMQIVKTYYDPIWTGKDAVPGEAQGVREPADLVRQVAGITYPNTISYTLSGDGLSLQKCGDAVRVFWSDGRYTHHQVERCYFKETLRRISRPEKVENRADRAYQANCGPVVPNMPTPITTDLCPGNLVSMTYFCGGDMGCPYVCCPRGLPYLNHCDCKCYATADFECHSYSKAKEQPRQ